MARLQKPRQPDDTEVPAVVLPSKVRVIRPFGYYDESGKRCHWHTGTVVTDPVEVATLIGRGAPVHHLEG